MVFDLGVRRVNLTEKTLHEVSLYLRMRRAFYTSISFANHVPISDQMFDDLAKLYNLRVERMNSLVTKVIHVINQLYVGDNERLNSSNNNIFFSITAFSRNVLPLAINYAFYDLLLRVTNSTSLSNFYSYIPLTFVGRLVKLGVNREYSIFAYLEDRVAKDTNFSNKEKIMRELHNFADLYYSLSCFCYEKILESISVDDLSKFLSQFFTVVNLILENRTNLDNNEKHEISKSFEISMPSPDFILLLNTVLEINSILKYYLIIEPIKENISNAIKFLEIEIPTLDVMSLNKSEYPYSLALNLPNLFDVICYILYGSSLRANEVSSLELILKETSKMLLYPTSLIMDTYLFSSALISYLSSKYSELSGTFDREISPVRYGIGSKEIIY